MSFVTKKDAINHYDRLSKGKNTELYLFQEDINNKAKKQFLVKTTKDIYDKITIDNKNNHYYEFWQKNTSIKFALDLDILKQDPILGPITYEQSQDVLKKNIQDVLYYAEQYYDHVYNVDDIMVLETLPQELSEKKYSYHVIFDGLMFASHLVCKDFFRRMKKETELFGCDESIYNLGCLRIMGSTKKGEERILEPVQYRINKKLTKIGTDLNFFRSTLITYTENINGDNFIDESFIENSYEELIDEKDVGDKDKDCKIDNIDIEKILNELPLEVCDNYQPWLRVGMILYNTSKKADTKLDLFEMYNKWSSKSKKYKGTEDVKKYWKQLANQKTNSKLGIGSLIYEAKKLGISGYLKNGKKSNDVIVNEYPKKVIQLTSKPNTTFLNQRYLTPELFTKHFGARLLAVQSEKGTGKTSNLIEAYFKNGLITDDMNILLISSRRTFGAKLLGDLNKYGFKLYSDFEEQYISHNRIICQLDSLMRLDRSKYHVIIVDECESVARYMTSQHFTKNHKATMIINMYESYLNSADNVYILDADLSDRCVNYYQKIMNMADDELSLIVNDYQLYTDYKVNYMRFNDWINQVMMDIEKNKKLVVAMASNAKGKDLRDIIVERFPNKRVLFLNRDVDDKEKIAIVSNVDEQWSRYDIVIYTPSVCMGVSYDKINHFDAIYAYGCEGSLGSQEFCQMIHRVRHPKTKIIYLTFDRYEEYTAEDQISYEQTEELICNDYYLTNYEIHTNIIPHKIRKIDDYMNFVGGKSEIIPYDENKKTVEETSTHRNQRVIYYPYKQEPEYELYVRNCMETIENKNNFCWSVFGYLKHKEYKLEYLKVENGIEYAKLLKDNRKVRVEKEKEDFLERIIETADIEENEFYELKRKREELRTDEERMKLRRFQFKKCFDIENLSEDKEKTKELFQTYDDPQKKKHYRNLRCILNTSKQNSEQKLDIIRANIKNDNYRKNAYSDLITSNIYTTHKFALQFIDMLGFDINDLSKTVSDDDFKIRIEDIKDAFNDEYNNICYKFNCKIRHKNFVDLEDKDSSAFIKKIIKLQYGFDIKKDKDNYIMIVPFDSTGNIWTKLYEYKKNKNVENEKLNDLIEPINISDKIDIDDGFIED
jgi:hypothetical protein